MVVFLCANQEKRQQLLTEIRTLCEAPCYEGLVEFHGAFYTPDSGQISIALEYMDGGSLADILRMHRRIPEPILSSMFQKLLHVMKIILYFCFQFLISKCTKICYLAFYLLEGSKLSPWSQTSSSQRHKACQSTSKSQGGAKDY